MFKTLSKLYRDLLHQNIELHNENTTLRMRNRLLQQKIDEHNAFLYELHDQMEKEIKR